MGAAARVSDCDVKSIIDDTVVTDFTSYIRTAHAVVEAHLLDKNLGEAMLTEIERWLAAHFVAVRDPRLYSQKTGDASETYHGKVDLGYNVTPYGQQALALDSSGTLATMGKPKAFFKSL